MKIAYDIKLNVCYIYFVTDDLSYNKVASQSSPVTGNYNDAKNAVDRNVTTCMKTNDIGGSSPRTTVWWKVDLGRIYSINSVNIFFKNYVGYGIEFYLYTCRKKIVMSRKNTVHPIS